MRMVVDSNYLRTKELRDWLAASPKNIAVLTDQAEMEMAKADTLEGFLKSTEVLADFPRQVVLAKEITAVSGIRGKKSGLKKRLADGKRTRAFRKWCKQRDAIKRGERHFKHHEAHENAKLHMEDVLKGGSNFKDDLVNHAATHYTPEELAIIRKGEKWNDAVTKKVLDGIMDFALKFYTLHPEWHELPESREVHLYLSLRPLRLSPRAPLDSSGRRSGPEAGKIRQRPRRCCVRRLRHVFRRPDDERQTRDGHLQECAISPRQRISARRPDAQAGEEEKRVTGCARPRRARRGWPHANFVLPLAGLPLEKNELALQRRS
jgi:hypothetical protein